MNSSALITCGTRNAQPTRAGRLPMGSGPPHCFFSFLSLVAFSRWRQDPLWLTIPIPHLASMRSGTAGEIRVPLSGRLACSPSTLMLGDRPDQTLIGSHSGARKMRHASSPADARQAAPGSQGSWGPLFPLRSCASVERKGVVGGCLAQRLACLLADNIHRAHTHSLTHSLAHSLTHYLTHTRTGTSNMSQAPCGEELVPPS